jgi:hypothetical protein
MTENLKLSLAQTTFEIRRTFNVLTDKKGYFIF